MSSSTDISPKKSPFSSTASTRSWSPSRLRISTLPSLMMYISVPRSPSRKTYSPAAKSRLSAATPLRGLLLVVLKTVLVMVRSSAEPQERGAGAPGPEAGGQPQGESDVGRPVAGVEPPGEGPGEAGEAVRDQRGQPGSPPG